MRPYLFQRRRSRQSIDRVRRERRSQHSRRRSGAWLLLLLGLLGCGTVGTVVSYLLLTDPAADMLALQQTAIPTPTARITPSAAPVVAAATEVPTSAAASPDTQAALLASIDAIAAAAQPNAPPSSLPHADLLRGNVRWTASSGPVVVQRNIVIPTGSRLVIEPGTEVRMDTGIAIVVEGELRVVGRPSAFARLVPESGDPAQRWQGIFGRPGSTITLDHAEIEGAGADGMMLASRGDPQQPSSLTIRDSRFNKNGGQIVLIDSYLDLRDTEITANVQPYGAAINGSYSFPNEIILIGNRLTDNQLGQDGAVVNIATTSGAATLTLQIQRNLVINGNQTAALALSLQAAVNGRISCNTLRGGSVGLDIRDTSGQGGALSVAVYNNSFEGHLPAGGVAAITSTSGYGALSEIGLNMYGNWWGDASGPFHPFTNPNGRGDAVGERIEYAGWLSGPPACAP